MSEKWHGGKGDKPRKNSNQKAYADNYDRIFGRKHTAQPQQHQPGVDPELEKLKKEQAQDPKNG
jgi:hypothetical protein